MNAPLPVLTQLPPGADRSKFLGGSDVAAIFGVSPWKTPYDLFMDKITPRSEDGEDLNEARRKFFSRRKRQEPVIAEMLADEFGVEVTRLSLDGNPNRYLDLEHPFLAAEIDFEFLMSDAVRSHFPERADFAAIPDGTLLNGEIKTVHPFKAWEWGEQGSEEVPIHYAAQVMHGLGVTRRPAALIAALFGLDTLLAFPVMRDDETVSAMRAAAVKFWTEHIVPQVPPAPVNTEDVTRMYSGFRGKPVALSPEAHEALLAIEALRERKQQIERDMNEAEWRVAQSVAFNWGVMVAPDKKSRPALESPDDATLIFDGRPVGSWNRQRGVFLDQKRLKQDKPEVIAEYSVEHLYRVFRLKKGKK